MLVTSPVLAQSSPELPDPGRTSISKEEQRKVGLQAEAQVYQQMPVLPDNSPVTQYVQQLSQKLVRTIPQQNSWPYQFHVIQQKEINAFALPGGPIFINLGTITAADNEAELAGVIAHEMSHVYLQHSAKAAGSQSWQQGIAAVLGGIMPNSTLGSIARMGIQLGGGLMSLKYSRKDEAQADATGAIIMYKAGYNPQAMAEFFQKLEQKGGGNPPQLLSDHPNPGNRVAAVRQEIRDWPQKNYQTNNRQFVSARSQAAGVRAYTSQEIAAGAKNGQWQRQNQQANAIPAGLPSVSPVSTNGNAAGAVGAPSSQLSPFDGPVFRVRYPGNWQAHADNNGVTIAPDAGVLQTGLSHGAIFQYANPSSNDLDQATNDVVQGVLGQNQGMRVVGATEEVTINRIRGRSVNLMGASPLKDANGRNLGERDWLVTLPTSDGRLLAVIFVAPDDSNYNQFHSAFVSMLKTLHLK